MGHFKHNSRTEKQRKGSCSALRNLESSGKKIHKLQCYDVKKQDHGPLIFLSYNVIVPK